MTRDSNNVMMMMMMIQSQPLLLSSFDWYGWCGGIKNSNVGSIFIKRKRSQKWDKNVCQQVGKKVSKITQKIVGGSHRLVLAAHLDAP
jgi:hypothetical protein